MKIANINIPQGGLLAPLAGYTDVALRHLAKGYGAALTYTEMISCKGMVYGSEKTKELLALSPYEDVKCVQIFGNDPAIMADAVQMPEIQKFDIIDINMGCPVPKIVKNGEGSALLQTPQLASQIVRAVADASRKPVTVKTRLGFEHHNFVADTFAKAIEDGGVAAITVHGRYREQFYSGTADYDNIAKVVKAVAIPVIANGDIFSCDDYFTVLERTQAAACMVARGALGNPQVFLDIARHNGLATTFDDVNIKRDMLLQVEIMRQHFCDRYVYNNMKKHLCYYAKGRPLSKRIKDSACRAASVQDIIDTIQEYF